MYQCQLVPGQGGLWLNFNKHTCLCVVGRQLFVTELESTAEFRGVLWRVSMNLYTVCCMHSFSEPEVSPCGSEQEHRSKEKFATTQIFQVCYCKIAYQTVTQRVKSYCLLIERQSSIENEEGEQAMYATRRTHSILIYEFLFYYFITLHYCTLFESCPNVQNIFYHLKV